MSNDKLTVYETCKDSLDQLTFADIKEDLPRSEKEIKLLHAYRLVENDSAFNPALNLYHLFEAQCFVLRSAEHHGEDIDVYYKSWECLRQYFRLNYFMLFDKLPSS